MQGSYLSCSESRFAIAAAGILLLNLCDKTHRIGQIGYYLASYEAAIAHIREIDLSEIESDSEGTMNNR